MQGKKKYEEKLFTQVRLHSRIPNDNYYKILKRKLNLNFIYKLTKPYYSDRGKASLDPVVFFKLRFIKKREKISSDVKLMKLCKIRLDLIWFLGYNLDDKLPHHSTIYRTSRHLPSELVDEICDRIEQMAAQHNL